MGEVFAVFLRLGLTSFGGPVAHIGYFRTEFVERRCWLDERAFADLVALCQSLPGPASSQTGIGIGLMRAGLPGAFAAWLAFTAPSAAAMILFGLGLATLGSDAGGDALRGLKVVAVAVVVQAVWGMARGLCPDGPRRAVALAATLIVVVWPSSLGQVAAILAAGVVGALALRHPFEPPAVQALSVGRGLGSVCLVLFFVLLALLPVAAETGGSHALGLVDGFYRAGSLVFGGGHVVLPLLRSATVDPGWVTPDAFVAGYGAAQAVPGPLFTFAAYLGAVNAGAPSGLGGGLLCVAAIFLPSFLLVLGVLPFWEGLRRIGAMRRALLGVNAAVVGLLLAALYDPVWTSGIRTLADAGLALLDLLLLAAWRVSPWIVVLFSAAAGWGLATLL